jgi:hypothetical protein
MILFRNPIFAPLQMFANAWSVRAAWRAQRAAWQARRKDMRPRRGPLSRLFGLFWVLFWVGFGLSFAFGGPEVREFWLGFFRDGVRFFSGFAVAAAEFFRGFFSSGGVQ